MNPTRSSLPCPRALAFALVCSLAFATCVSGAGAQAISPETIGRGDITAPQFPDLVRAVTQVPAANLTLGSSQSLRGGASDFTGGKNEQGAYPFAATEGAVAHCFMQPGRDRLGGRQGAAEGGFRA